MVILSGMVTQIGAYVLLVSSAAFATFTTDDTAAAPTAAITRPRLVLLLSATDFSKSIGLSPPAGSDGWWRRPVSRRRRHQRMRRSRSWMMPLGIDRYFTSEYMCVCL